jgi:hypothetical protein
MCSRFLSITVVLVLAGPALAAPGGDKPSRHADRATINERGGTVTQGQRVVVRAGAQAPARFPVGPRDQPAAPRSYEGRIKDVRPVWGILVLTVGQGKKARDMRFDIGHARIVGPSGAEWKGQDLQVGDRVRVEMTAAGTLVQQLSVLSIR